MRKTTEARSCDRTFIQRLQTSLLVPSETTLETLDFQKPLSAKNTPFPLRKHLNLRGVTLEMAPLIFVTYVQTCSHRQGENVFWHNFLNFARAVAS